MFVPAVFEAMLWPQFRQSRAGAVDCVAVVKIGVGNCCRAHSKLGPLALLAKSDAWCLVCMPCLHTACEER